MKMKTTIVLHTDPQEKHCTGAHTYTTTHRNKTVNVYKIIHILYWYFQQSQCLNLRKTYSTQHTSISMGLRNCKTKCFILRYQVLGLFCSACIYSTCLYKTHMHQRLPYHDQTQREFSLNTCFIDVLQKLPSSPINLYCLSAEISKHQRYRSILHV
jgi:hypothetical protein